MTDGFNDSSNDQGLGGSSVLGQVTEHMEVVGSDQQPLGKVDKVAGDNIILTRTDSPDGQHHAFTSALIDRVENDKLVLNRTADDARSEFSDPDRDRSLAEDEGQGEAGPHILDQSFGGTY